MKEFKVTNSTIRTSAKFECGDVILWRESATVNGDVTEQFFELSVDNHACKRISEDVFYSVLCGDVVADFDFYERL